MNQQTLSAFIWSVADLLHGDYKQSNYSAGSVQDKVKVLLSEIVVKANNLF